MTTDENAARPTDSARTSRRRFLGGLTAAAGAAGLGTGVASAQHRDRNGDDGDRRDGGGRDGRNRGGGGGADADQFSRLFDLPSFHEDAPDDLREALLALGAAGGPMDAQDPLEVGPTRLITEPELSPNNPDNAAHTAGTTFVGQFLDHDITGDAGSRLGRVTPLRRSRNLRTAAFDLDSVYGAGPADDAELYRDDDPILFRLESGGQFEDLPRDADGTAVTAEGRNDENLIICGIQCGYYLFHNAVVERLRAGPGGADDDAVFAEARRLVRWHHQWMILHEFLPQVVGQAMIDEVAGGGRRFFTPDVLQIPVEFQTAAYRFGHSMIRPSYRANLAGDDGEAFFGFVFDPDEFDRDDPGDMSGGRRAPRRFVGWQTFFDFDDGEVKPNKRIDPRISTPLFQLPVRAIGTNRGEPVGPTSLAQRNLLRHITWEIPSGQRVAEAMGVAPLSGGDLSEWGDLGGALDTNTPLWPYILREAELVEDGERLGPVGGRIVAEVFLGLLEDDPDGYLSNEPAWRPTMPTRSGDDDFGMADLLTLAGVDPDSRGQ